MPMIAVSAIVGLLCFAAWRDLLTRTIPDLVSVAIVVLGIALRAPEGWAALAASLLVAIALFCLLLPFNHFGVVGGADLKLLSALATGLSPLVSYRLVSTVALVGAVLAFAYICIRRIALLCAERPRPRSRMNGLPRRFLTVELWRIRKGAPLPYGVAIAAGAALVLIGHPGV